MRSRRALSPRLAFLFEFRETARPRRYWDEDDTARLAAVAREVSAVAREVARRSSSSSSSSSSSMDDVAVELPASERGANDGLGAQESVSEVVGEVFSGYACTSIEVSASGDARARKKKRV